jgi:hypothetical protein
VWLRLVVFEEAVSCSLRHYHKNTKGRVLGFTAADLLAVK